MLKSIFYLHNISDWYSSGPIDLSLTGDVSFYCEKKDGKEIRYLKVNVTQEGATLFATLEEQEPSETSYQIVNNLDTFSILVHQIGYPDQCFIVKNNSKIPYAWANSIAKNTLVAKLCIENEYSDEMSISLNGVKELKTEKLNFRNESIVISHYIKIKGKSKILKFTHEKILKQRENQVRLQILGSFKGIGLSLISKIKKRRIELFYLSLAPFYFALIENGQSTTMQVRIKYITIDNMINMNVTYPVMLYPEHITKEKEAKQKYTLDLLFRKKNFKDSTQVN